MTDRIGEVCALHVAPAQGAPVEPRDSVQAVARRGLSGDRYFADEGTFGDRDGSDLTLIEREALDAVEADYGIDLAPGVHRGGLRARIVDGGAITVGDPVATS